MNRRTLLQASLAGLLGARFPGLATAAVAADARPLQLRRRRSPAPASRVGLPYLRPLMKLTEPFADLKYDQFRAIRFRDEKRLFADNDRGFRMDLHAAGLLLPGQDRDQPGQRRVAEPIAFSTDYFAFHPDYFPFPDGQAPAGLAADMGFSGIRLRTRSTAPGSGTSSRSSRARATSAPSPTTRSTASPPAASPIGTGGPDREEFPIFTAFWIHEPQPGDPALRLSALLDSDWWPAPSTSPSSPATTR